MHSPADIVDCNLRTAMGSYASVAGGDQREHPGLLLSFAGINYSVFNSAMFTAPVVDESDLDRRLALASVHFNMRGAGWTAWVCEDTVPRALHGSLDSIFTRRGLRMLTAAPGMYADRLSAPSHPLEIDWRPVHDARTRFDFADIACVVFALPFRVSYAIYAEPGFWSSATRGYVAYESGKPVAVVSTVRAGGAVGVYSLGTLPQHRRRGYGESLMRRALEEEANQGPREPLILQATDAGYPLYRAMGYRSVTRFRVYEHSGCGAAR